MFDKIVLISKDYLSILNSMRYPVNNIFLNFEFQELETLLENAKTPLPISRYFDD